MSTLVQHLLPCVCGGVFFLRVKAGLGRLRCFEKWQLVFVERRPQFKVQTWSSCISFFLSLFFSLSILLFTTCPIFFPTIFANDKEGRCHFPSQPFSHFYSTLTCFSCISFFLCLFFFLSILLFTTCPIFFSTIFANDKEGRCHFPSQPFSHFFSTLTTHHFYVMLFFFLSLFNVD